MPIKALELREEIGLGKIAVEDSNGVIRIKCCHQIAVHVPNCGHMPRRDVSGGADQSKIRRHTSLENAARSTTNDAFDSAIAAPLVRLQSSTISREPR